MWQASISQLKNETKQKTPGLTARSTSCSQPFSLFNRNSQKNASSVRIFDTFHDSIF